VDASSSSLTVGTGQQTLTLAATAGVDRGWIVGTSVLLSASTVTNTMTGVVVSYTASTQVLVVNVASVVGSGTYSTWQVSNLMPRLDYNPSTLAAQGLLIEESRTNLQVNSENPAAGTGWIPSELTVSSNATAAPSGVSNAAKLIPNTNNVTHHIEWTSTVVASTQYIASVFLKAAEETVAVLWNNVGGAIATFNLSAGTITSGSGTITSVGNGWYRCSISYTPSGTSGQIRTYVRQSTAYAGNGVNGLFIWGAQLEAGAFPTSYIPTTTTALTRAADVASVNTLSPWYNATEGTLYAQGILVGGTAGTFPYQAALVGSNANNDSIGVQWTAASGLMRFGVRSGGVAQADIPAGSGKSAGSSYKVAGRYAANDFQAAGDGSLGTADTSGSVPTITALSLGGPVAFQVGASVWLQRVTYYPQGLSNAQLQAITA
jgi:hypothetical protein